MNGSPLIVIPLASASSRDGNDLAVIVGAVAGNIDHPPDTAIAAIVEKPGAELDRTRNRGARRAPVGRRRQLADKGVGAFRSLDHAPGDDHLLLVIARPFQIRDRDLADHALAHGIEKFARGEPADIAFALQRQLLRIHGIGNVDRNDELDIDRDAGRLGRRARHLRIAARCARHQHNGTDHGAGGPASCKADHRQVPSPAFTFSRSAKAPDRTRSW